MKQIIVVGGGKGGVGKSMVSMCLLDILREQSLIYIETDDSNPDVYKAVNGSVTSHVINIDTESGYLRLGEVLETENPDYVVINTAARATQSLIEHSVLLSALATETGANLSMVWAMNRQRDGLELLKSFMDNRTGYDAVYAVKNLYFGLPEKFLRYDNSKIKGKVNQTLELPELNDLLADKLVDERLPLWTDTKDLQTMQRSSLQKFRDLATKSLKPVIVE